MKRTLQKYRAVNGDHAGGPTVSGVFFKFRSKTVQSETHGLHIGMHSYSKVINVE